jgi:hypothetical protein
MHRRCFYPSFRGPLNFKLKHYWTGGSGSVSLISPVAILPTMMAPPMASAGRFSPSGPRGIVAVVKESPEKLHKLVLALAAFIQEGGDVHLVRVGTVTGPAHVTALLFMLDK